MNFIGDLLSVEGLQCNAHLRDLYLTGNPCTEYEGYRDFVVASLPQLVTLDGKEITKSERISATQQLATLRQHIAEQQTEHALKRKREKEAYQHKHASSQKRKPGFDGRWYTDPHAHVCVEEHGNEEQEENEEEVEAYTPEYRVQNHRDMVKKKMEQAKEPE